MPPEAPRDYLPGGFHVPAEVFRSARRRACEEAAFVLTAVGIASEVEFDGSGYVVVVEEAVREQARYHLWKYGQERSAGPPPEPALPPRPGAWRGSAVYAAVLLAIPFALAQDWLPVDPYEAGVMDPARMRAGQWWRALTALTLHWDAPHLVGNLGAGALLGYSASEVWGGARGWLLIVTAAALANLVEGAFGAAHYVSAGASTAVFAALGLVAAWAWRTRREHAATPLRRWVPLVAGLGLLGMFGAGAAEPGAEAADPTNVLSHALGFGSGALLGAVVATRRVARGLAAIPAWIAASVALGSVAVAWILALGRTAAAGSVE